ncbi:S53 family peptidase [Iamia majanohamensis]|uniref:S53 family peptidase n=1 Tax=Iamia majanohamensis TaxID=467976 RepID=A0AAF0BTR7_9ACTN|nr:S53 family peptidase [Iamia majanohamensis]WCO67132.1 S53 family peptidase [Iamia majanohamensis]
MADQASSTHQMAPRRSRRVGWAVALLVLVASVAVAGGASVAPAGAEPAVAWEDTSPDGQPRTGDADPDDTLTVHLGLRHVDTVGLEAAARAVSDPASSRYGQHLSLSEVASGFGAPPHEAAAVVAALAAEGIEARVGATGTQVVAPMTVGQASTFFATTWGTYGTGDDATELPDTAPTLPAGLAEVVSLVTGLVPDPAVAAAGAAPAAGRAGPPTLPVFGGGAPFRTGVAEGCPEGTGAAELAVGSGQYVGLFPNQLADAYGLSTLRDAGIDGAGVRAAVVGFGAPSSADLGVFADCLGLDTSAVHVEADPGTDTYDGNALEATLDVQTLLAAAPGLDRLDVYALEQGQDVATFVDLLEAPLAAAAAGRPLPHLVSVSYGLCEPAWVGDPAALLVEQVLAGAALAGVGYQIASGDNGSSDCVEGTGATDIAVDYPAASEWTTAVGGTNLGLDAGNAIASQGVWNDDVYPDGLGAAYPDSGGGGGRSIAISRPAHQRGPGVPAGGTRLVPDIALFADPWPGYAIYCIAACPVAAGATTGWQNVGGTSASTPLTTGALALVTEHLTRARGTGGDAVRLGLVSPVLWELGRQGSDVLRDVTIGDNDVAGVGCCAAGPGFDLASGWGSLDAGHLAAALGPVPVDLTASVGTSGADGRAPVRLDAQAAPSAGRVTTWTWSVDGAEVATTDAGTLDLALPVGPHEVEVRVRTDLAAEGVAATGVDVTAAPGPGGGVGPTTATPAQPVRAAARFTG